MVDEIAAQMAVEYKLPKKWLNSHATAFQPENARWLSAPTSSSGAIKLADLPTLAAMKIAAEREKDIIDLGHLVNALEINDPMDVVELA